MCQLWWWPSSLCKILRWKLEKEILAIKHKNNISYHEAQKMVAGSKTPAYSYAVQRGKDPHKKYEDIVKTLI